jgi:hypothetical protein
MKKIIIAIALFALLAGCSAKPASTVGESTAAAGTASDAAAKGSAAKTLDGEIKFYPTYDSEYKTARNEIFDFWFDIPQDWKAVDQSEDGSEYTILTGNDKVELTTCGILNDGKEEAYYAKLAGDSGTITDFTYRDGWIGKQITIGDTESWYVRVDGDSYIVMHIKAADQKEWMEQNKEKLEYVAMSERTTRESYGNSLGGENSVTPGDLQLGGVKLEMSYDELMGVLPQKPEKEETEEYDGLQAKTLFFADNTQVYMVEDSVYSINVTSPDYPTPRGLKVGDSEARLTELYGEADNKDENGCRGYNCNGYQVMTVIIKDGKVAEIQVDLAM